jgi:hypothetical protein
MAMPWFSLNCWDLAKKLRHKQATQRNKEILHFEDVNEFE